jgi:hypothetical protein
MSMKLTGLVLASAAAVALTPAAADAYGAAHVGYTHVGPNGVYHTGATATANGGYHTSTGYHSTNPYGGGYHYGATSSPYGGGYHYGATGYGGYGGGGGYHYSTGYGTGGGYHYSYVR